MSEQTPSRGMIVRTGVHRELEDVANEMIRQSLVGVTRHEDKKDILTPWKQQSRLDREVYSSVGVPDGALRRGNFNRVLNRAHPHLNSIEAYPPPKAEYHDPSGRPSTHHGATPWDME
jgi:hypothetical protein